MSPSDRNKTGQRARLGAAHLRVVMGEGGKSEPTNFDVVGVTLGYRMVFSEQAEVWTVTGILRDGEVVPQELGTLSFCLIPGDTEPATAVVGFVSPPHPYKVAISKDELFEQMKMMVMQLGYDLGGFYLSIAVGGEQRYYEDFRR
jgi:hypothetical protein